MPRLQSLGLAVLAAAAIAGGPARAASCQAEHMMCATAMPVGGYCECTARGATESGTVVDKPMSRRVTNATAGGCGAHPNAPGCR
jgi:hypothetical protein